MLPCSFLCGWWPFIRSVVAENNFLCPFFCRMGPAIKYAVFSFLCGWGRSFTWLWPRIIILRIGFGFCVSLNWTIYFLVVFVSVASCRSYPASSISDPFFLFNCISIQILYSVVAEKIQSTGVVFSYFFSYGVPHFLFFFSLSKSV